MSSPFQALVASIQENCLPGIWSKGVAHARNHDVTVDSVKADELIFRVRVIGRSVSPKVTLWPEDEDAYCDCGEKVEPCAHVAAAAAYLKTGGSLELSADALKPPVANHVRYCFLRREDALFFERRLIVADKPEMILEESLISFVGGIQSGRIKLPPLVTTKADLAVDSALGTKKRGMLDSETMKKLLAVLAECSNVFLDGVSVTTLGTPLKTRARLVDLERNGAWGYLLEQLADIKPDHVFLNGAALCGSVLRPVPTHTLLPEQEEWLREPHGHFFPAHYGKRLVLEILPALQKRIEVLIQAERLPEFTHMPVSIDVKLIKDQDQDLVAIPRIVYGVPPLAELDPIKNELIYLDPKQIPIRDIAAERAAERLLQSTLHLKPGQLSRYSGQNAIEFMNKLKQQPQITRSGEGEQTFKVLGKAKPQLSFSADGSFDAAFECDGKTASLERVLQSWRENASLVPLLDGGWAELPLSWLNEHGHRLEQLLRAREHGSKLPKRFALEVGQMQADLGDTPSSFATNLRRALEEFNGIPDAKLPSDLKADLRDYQKKGIAWLCFLRDQGLGGVLADDMGLGKTLQALCAIKGRTLIIAPTSVLYSWRDQTKKFRPSLSVNLFHGANRKHVKDVDITLTSYAIARLDQEALSAQNWDTIIIDEAQMIKNAESQTARAVFSLTGEFRLALTGTPVENRLEDLWSQFQFVNPGLLGSRTDFQEEFVQPITSGDPNRGKKLRTRIRPFLLRRLKRDVAPELPPRTETVLHTELSTSERELYESVLAATKRDIILKLETPASGVSMMAVLEALLRLRQACCHPALLPGQKADTSSKAELLLETLEQSFESGHRALVFSQWTSLLDQLQPLFDARAWKYSRLDGTTRDRDAIVKEFQDPNGPQVMLISLKAGGVGLTLTAADHVFILDPWWNPAVEDQAADRAHRIGQTNPVLIHRLVAKNTIEERILELQSRKRELAATALEDSQVATRLTKEDILELLQG